MGDISELARWRGEPTVGVAGIIDFFNVMELLESTRAITMAARSEKPGCISSIARRSVRRLNFSD